MELTGIGGWDIAKSAVPFQPITSFRGVLFRHRPKKSCLVLYDCTVLLLHAWHGPWRNCNTSSGKDGPVLQMGKLHLFLGASVSQGCTISQWWSSAQLCHFPSWALTIGSALVCTERTADTPASERAAPLSSQACCRLRNEDDEVHSELEYDFLAQVQGGWYNSGSLAQQTPPSITVWPGQSWPAPVLG